MGRSLMPSPQVPSPRVVVLGGVNGAGKSTAAVELLNVLEVPVFTNADTIARGLNALHPESVAFAAGRVMLDWINTLAEQRRDFAFETTLAARSYVTWLKDLKQTGYRIMIFYTWVASAEVAIARVAQRVRAGGHHVPAEDIRRRYSCSVRNFLELYRPLADEWELVDNTHCYRTLVAVGNQSEMLVEQGFDWDRVLQSAE